MKKLDLCNGKWNLIYVKNEAFKKDGSSFTTITALREKGYPEIPATVPGNLEIDLENAGIIDDPFFADNHRKRDCEYLHMFYHRKFVYDGSLVNPCLTFEGLDTIADVYLNGVLIGSPENMLIAHDLEVRDALRLGENELCVHIKPAVIEARKYPYTSNEITFKYNTESLYIRKAPHMYVWDIMPRIVSGGIWKPVYLSERKNDRITEFYLCTKECDPEANTASLYFSYNSVISSDECLDYNITVKGVCGEAEFYFKDKLWFTAGSHAIKVENAKLWWPRYSGDANLYNVTVTLDKNGKILDEYKTRIGIRTAKLVRTSTTNENGEGDFCFVVNGKRIFCMGTNWVPADALHSRDAKRLPDIMPMITDIGCNIIRIWGGNVYEDDMLYDFCDENGVMIWQDFIMGCAYYPQTKDFRDRLYAEAVSVVKRLRDHPSIVLWAGDNECDIACSQSWRGDIPVNPNDNLLTRSVLKEAIRVHDRSRTYLPSSPYMDEYAYKSHRPTTEDHLWGPRDYFKGDFYKNSVCHFASETGYHACNSPVSVEKFIPKEYVWTSENSENWNGIDNTMWLAHATALEDQKGAPFNYRIRLMANQVSTLFGKTVPNTLSDFAKASQISQAEAKKYFIERFRVSKWRRTGIIWWNLIDGWPQFSDAIVDYYYIKKIAYHYVKRSQNPLCLMCDEPKNNILPLYAVNEFPNDKVFSYKVTDLTANKTVCEGHDIAKAESSVLVCNIPISPDEKHFYFIEWECNGIKYTNHYMTNIIDIDYNKYLGYMDRCGYSAFEGFDI